MAKLRQSNIELLRVIIMYLILLLHANIFTFGWPEGETLTSMFRYLMEGITIVAVNIFVLITGYFGTSFKLSKIANLVFQLIFTVFSVTLLLLVFNLHHFDSWKDVIHGFYFWDYWFINAYIVLLILSPLPNLAIKNLSKSSIRALLVALFFVFSIIEGDFFISPPGVGVNSGFSVIWFLYMYLVGRYIATYPPRIRIKKLIAIYIISLFGAVFLMWKCHDYGYNSPFIAIGSVAIFLLFLKFDFSSQSINFIASSSLMVFLLHFHPILIEYYKGCILDMNDKYGNSLLFVFMLVCFCLVVYVVAILYDQLRKFVWSYVEPHARRLDKNFVVQ
jgi:surface polysaccharide O-acyltransferase-like enzyme